MAYYAYIHCKPDGTPFYVGKGLADRVRRIRRKNKGHNAIVDKYGEAAILVGKMECSTDDTSKDLERGLIKRLKAMGAKLVNATEGGDGCVGYKPSPEVLLKMSLQRKGKPLTEAQLRAIRETATKRIGVKRPNAKKLLGDKNPMRKPENREKVSQRMKGNQIWLGRKLTDEHKRKIGDANRGRPQGEEQRAKMRAAKLGTKQSEETKRKRSASLTGRAGRSGVVWVTNGHESKTVYPSYQLQDGWRYGRTLVRKNGR